MTIDEETIRQNRAALLYAVQSCLPYGVYQKLRDDYERFPAYSADDPSSRISYAPKSDYLYDSNRRVKTTLGRFLRKFYGIEITPEIELGIQAVFGQLAYDPARFEIVDDVKQAYTDCAMNGVTSCMVTEPDDEPGEGRDCLDFYTDRCAARVVVYYDPKAEYDNYPSARALLFATSDGGLYLDRIYPNSGAHIPHYRKWVVEYNDKAKQENKPEIYMRPNHSAGIPDNDDTTRHTTIDVEAQAGDELPYIDTFPYLSRDGRTLSTRYSEYCVCCQSTGSPELKRCDHCDGVTLKTIEIDGESCCGYCASKVNHCYRCGCRTFADMTEIDGHPHCDDCAAEFPACERCDTVCHESDTHQVDGATVCYRCYRNAHVCQDCDCRTFETRRHDGDIVCQGCYDNRCDQELVTSLEIETSPPTSLSSGELHAITTPIDPAEVF